MPRSCWQFLSCKMIQFVLLQSPILAMSSVNTQNPLAKQTVLLLRITFASEHAILLLKSHVFFTYFACCLLGLFHWPNHRIFRSYCPRQHVARVRTRDARVIRLPAEAADAFLVVRFMRVYGRCVYIYIYIYLGDSYNAYIYI